MKHLNRRELIDIIYRLKKSEQELQAENKQLREQLEMTDIIDGALKKAEDIIRKATEQRDVIVAETQKAYALLKKYDDAIEKKRAELQSTDAGSSEL